MKKVLSIICMLMLSLLILNGCGSSTSEKQVAPGVYAQIPNTWNEHQVDGGGMAYDVLDENGSVEFSCQFIGPYEQSYFPTITDLLNEVDNYLNDFYAAYEPTNIEKFKYEENGANEAYVYFDSTKFGSSYRHYFIQNDYSILSIMAESKNGDFTTFEEMLSTLYFE